MLEAALFAPFLLLTGWLLTLHIRNRNARLRAAAAGRCLPPSPANRVLASDERVCLLNVH